MKIHHINAGSMCPVGGAFLPDAIPSQVVCHCLLVETADRLVLIDTGLGVDDLRNPRRLGPMRWLLNTTADEERTAVGQVRSLGFSPSDVTDIIPTHLDLDHAGGLVDFPGARVHVFDEELEAARSRGSFRTRHRYRPTHLSPVDEWCTFDLDDGGRWKGFRCVKSIPGLPPEILLVRLPGHTPGHFGVAVDTGDRWMLHAGDAFYHRWELTSERQAPLGLRVFQRIVHMDHSRALETQQQLADIHNRDDLTVVCSHDPAQLEQFDISSQETASGSESRTREPIEA